MDPLNKIIAGLGLIVLCSACATEEDAGSNQRGGFAIPVKLGKVVIQDVKDRIRLVGNIQSDQQLTLSPEVEGAVVELLVEEGTPVHKDQLLARIDPERYRLEVERLENEEAAARQDVEMARKGLRPEDKARLLAQLKSAQSSLDLAQKNYTRQSALYKEGIVSKSKFDIASDELNRAREMAQAAAAELEAGRESRKEDIVQLEARLEEKRRELEIARLDLDRTEIRSPFKGVIVSKETDLGSYVEEGSPIFKMIGTGRLTAVLHLPQQYGNRMRDLESVTIQLKDSGIQFQLKDHLHQRLRVVPMADIHSGSLFVMIGLPDPDPSITAGQTFEADLYFKERKNILLVPSIALTLSEMGSAVYIAKEGKAHLVPVKAGREKNNLVEVTDFTHQLNPKVDLIMRGSGAVFPGAQIMPSPPQKAG